MVCCDDAFHRRSDWSSREAGANPRLAPGVRSLLRRSREERDRPERLSQVLVLSVRDQGDNLVCSFGIVWRSFDPEASAHGICAVQELAREGFIDDGNLWRVI